MKKRLLPGIACAALAIVLLLGGCGAVKRDSVAAPEAVYLQSSLYRAYDGYSGYEDKISYTNAINYNGDYTTTSGSLGERFVAAQAQVSIQTKTYNDFNTAMKGRLKEYEGYIEAYEEQNYSYGREANVIVRVPSAKLDAFLDSLEANGSVLSKSVSFTDFTDDLIESGSRKKALEAEETALLAILEKADTVQDIITVQDRISKVRSELESYMQKIQSLHSKVDYSTVRLYVREVERISAPSQRFGSQAGAGFLASLKNIGVGFRDFALGFIGAIPYLALLAVPAAIALILLRRFWKRRKAKKAGSKA